MERRRRCEHCGDLASHNVVLLASRSSFMYGFPCILFRSGNNATKVCMALTICHKRNIIVRGVSYVFGHQCVGEGHSPCLK